MAPGAARAQDMHYYDMKGRAILDGSAGLWCCNAGHCRQPIVDAIQKQAAELDFAPTFQYGHPKIFELANKLATLAPGDLNYAFFCNSGSEAADTAMKMALAYHRSRGEGVSQAAKSGDHFVENKQNAVLVAQFAQTLQIALGRRQNAS